MGPSLEEIAMEKAVVREMARGIMRLGDRWERNGQLDIEELGVYAKGEYGDFVDWILAFVRQDNGLRSRQFKSFDVDRNGKLDLPELEVALALWRYERDMVGFKVYGDDQDVIELSDHGDTGGRASRGGPSPPVEPMINLYPRSSKGRCRPATSRPTRGRGQPKSAERRPKTARTLGAEPTRLSRYHSQGSSPSSAKASPRPPRSPRTARRTLKSATSRVTHQGQHAAPIYRGTSSRRREWGRPSAPQSGSFRLDGVALAYGNDTKSWHMYSKAGSRYIHTEQGLDTTHSFYQAIGHSPPSWWPQRNLAEVVARNGGSVTICRAPLPNGHERLACAENERKTSVVCPAIVYA